MTDRIRLIKHEAAPRCGSYVARFADGRPSVFFYFDDLSAEPPAAAGAARTRLGDGTGQDDGPPCVRSFHVSPMARLLMDQKNITQIAAPHNTTNHTIDIQTSTSSRLIPHPQQASPSQNCHKGYTPATRQ
jgi:hypothetical protein